MLKSYTCKAQVTISRKPQAITNPTPIMKLYCGQRLKDDKGLNKYSVQSGSTIHALKKTVSEDQVQVRDPLDSVSMQQQMGKSKCKVNSGKLASLLMVVLPMKLTMAVRRTIL